MRRPSDDLITREHSDMQSMCRHVLSFAQELDYEQSVTPLIRNHIPPFNTGTVKKSRVASAT